MKIVDNKLEALQ